MMRSIAGTLSKAGQDVGSSISRIRNIAAGAYGRYDSDTDRLNFMDNIIGYDINKDIQSPVKPEGMRAKDFFDMGGWL